MSSEDNPSAKRSRYDTLEEHFRGGLQATADDILECLQRYIWSRSKFGTSEFHLTYGRKLQYDIDPYILDNLVQATHESLCEEYKGSPFDETLVPSHDVFAGILDLLVAKYKP